MMMMMMMITWCYHWQNYVCLIVLPFNHVNFIKLLSCEMPEAFWYMEFIMTSHYPLLTLCFL